VTISDGGLAWREHPDPVPGERDLVVEVRAAGVNAADLHQARGLYPAPPGYPPDIPGLELAGEVVATGARVSRFSVGDRVMAVVGGGAQAELALVDEGSAIGVPDEITWEEAGGFPEAFTTAYDALFTQCELTVGERVLVTGAAGGVGTAAVQLVAAAGAVAVASVRSPDQRDSVVATGASFAFSPEEAIRHGPFDVALELVGGSSLPSVLSSMATGGRICVIGVGGGGSAEIDLLSLMARRVRISASTLRARSLTEKAVIAARVENHVVPLFASSKVRVPIEATFELPKASDAYERFSAGKKLGKIVLVSPGGR
jgi:NADPH2:quinone reductase